MITKSALSKLGKMVGHMEGENEKESKKEDMIPGDKKADMKMKLKKYRQNKISMLK